MGIRDDLILWINNMPNITNVIIVCLILFAFGLAYEKIRVLEDELFLLNYVCNRTTNYDK